MLAPRGSCDVVVTLPEVAVVRLDPSAAEWPVQVDRLRALSGAPDNPQLFPAHFLKATFPKLGGHLLLYRDGDVPVAVGFAFPSGLHGSTPAYTLRLHGTAAAPADPATLAALARRALDDAAVTPYDPTDAHAYRPTRESVEGISYGAPSADEAEAIRAL